MKKSQIEKLLEQIGACWAVKAEKFISPNDGGEPWERKPTWHIHPDASNPRQENILCFDTLSDIQEWIETC